MFLTDESVPDLYSVSIYKDDIQSGISFSGVIIFWKRFRQLQLNISSWEREANGNVSA